MSEKQQTPVADREAQPPNPDRDRGLHRHEHLHGDRAHRHPHHHTGPVAHEHAHTLAFEKYSYICSPVHDLDPRAKVISATILVLGIVLSPAPRLTEFLALVVLLAAIVLLADLPLPSIAARTAVVLPIAGSIALFAPLATLGTEGVSSVREAYAVGWPLAWSIVSKGWLSASVLVLLSATTTPPKLFLALRRLRMPLIFLTMLTFLYRYAAVLADQLTAMRRAVASRGPRLRRWSLVRLYGNLAGNLFIRAYERGERVHAAMLSRGFNGTLPTSDVLALRGADVLAFVTAVLVSAAVALY